MTKPISRKMAVDCLLWHVQLSDNPIICRLCSGVLFAGDAVQFDHIHADVFNGPHDYRNLRPVHAECHKSKTAQDIKANAKVKRLADPKPSKHPMKSSGRKIPTRPFPKRAA